MSNHELLESPIKGTAEALDIALIRQQADLTANCLVPVTYKGTRGTCGDERRRVHLLNGDPISEVRPSVFGGPVVHGTVIAELTSSFTGTDQTALQRAKQAYKILAEAGYLAGAHVACAAAKIGVWMRVMADNPDAIKAYGRMQLGADYHESFMDTVIGNATEAADSGRYNNFDENSLQQILGPEESGVAFEVLDAVDHEGYLVERNDVPGTTVDQNVVYDQSVAGKGSFDVDDCYAAELETAMITALTPQDITRNILLARHAREAIIAAVSQVVPNQTLYQDTSHEQA